MPEAAAEEDDIDWLLEETQAAPDAPAIEDFEDDEAFESSLAASEAFGGALTDTSLDESPDTEMVEAASEADEDAEIPDWLQDAGWEPRDPSKPEEPVERVAPEPQRQSRDQHPRGSRSRRKSSGRRGRKRQ